MKQADVIRELTIGAPKAKHIVVFDACRTELNLPKPAAKGVGGEKGFTGIPEHVGMLIAYAKEENQTAKDTGQYATILTALARANVRYAPQERAKRCLAAK